MKFTVVGDVTLHYSYRAATANPPLVFLNALGSDLRIWQAVIAQLPPHIGTLSYDQRGHGLSDAPPGPYTLQGLAAELVGLLDHVAIARALLVGLSVGGMVAQQVAIRFPQRVAGLVLCDTGAKIGTAAYWTERADAVRTAGLAPLTDAILARWFSADFATTYQAAYRGYANMLTRTPAEGYAATCDALRDGDLRSEVAQIAVPTLVLCGEADLATPPALAQALADAIPHARFGLIKQAGHMPSLEQPTSVAAAIRRFWEGVADVHG